LFLGQAVNLFCSAYVSVGRSSGVNIRDDGDDPDSDSGKRT
jgi:hypothetical protein